MNARTLFHPKGWMCFCMLLCVLTPQASAQTRIDWSKGRPDFQVQPNSSSTWESRTPVWLEAFHNIERMPAGWVQVQRSMEPPDPKNPQPHLDDNPDSSAFPKKLFHQRGMGFIDAYLAEQPTIARGSTDKLALYQVLTNPQRYNIVALDHGLPSAFNHEDVIKLEVSLDWKGTLSSDTWTSTPRMVIFAPRNGTFHFEEEVFSLSDFGQSPTRITKTILFPAGAGEIGLSIRFDGFKGTTMIDNLVVRGLNAKNAEIASYDDNFEERHGMAELQKFHNATGSDLTHLNLLVYMRDLIPLANDPRVATSDSFENALESDSETTQPLQLDALNTFLKYLPSNYRVFLKVNLDPDEAFLFPELHAINKKNGDSGVPVGDPNYDENIRQRTINFAVEGENCQYTTQTWRGRSYADFRYASVGSDEYQDYYQPYLSALISNLATGGHQDKIAGFMFGFSSTGENFYEGAFSDWVADYNPSFTTADLCDREGPNFPYDYYLPTDTNGLLSEMNDASIHTREMADVLSGQLTAAADIIRTAWGTTHPIVLGTYYSYLGEFSGGWGRMMTDGHTGALPNVDMIMAPSSYHVRGLEGKDENGDVIPFSPLTHGGGFMTMVDALHAQEIMMIQELDLRTKTTHDDLPPKDRGLSPTDDLSTVSQFKRETAMLAAHGTGAYYLDFGTEEHPWFDHLVNGNDDGLYWNLMGELYQAYPSVAETHGNELLPEAEVAFVVDRESLAYGYYNNAGLHTDLLSRLREEALKTGFRFDWLTMDALMETGAVNTNQYKMMVFLNTVTLTSAEYTKIQSLRANNRHMVFVHAPGYLERIGTSHTADIGRVRNLIFESTDTATLAMLEELPAAGTQIRPQITLYDGLGFPQADLNFGQTNTNSKNYPLLTLGSAKSITILGKYTDNMKYPAVWQRSYTNWTSVYMGAAGAKASIWRKLAEDAGVTIFANDDQFVHLGNNRLYVHVNPEGPQTQATITLPGNLELEAVSGTNLATKTSSNPSTFTIGASPTAGASLYKVTRNTQSPDLSVTGLSVSPSSPTAGTSFDVQVQVQNVGDAMTSGGASLILYRDGSEIANMSLSNFTPGQSRSYTISTTIQNPGTYNLQACVTTAGDPVSGNNCMDRDVPVVPAPESDLVIDQLSTSPTNPRVGDTITITARVKNQGSATTSQNALVRIRVNGSQIGVFSSPSLLAGGANHTGSVSYTITSTGTLNIEACADVQTNESQTSNNCQTITRNPTYVDLNVTAISTSPTSPIQGENFTVYVTVRNDGTAATSQSSTLSLTANGTSIGSQTISSLSAGVTTTRSFTMSWATAQTITLEACVAVHPGEPNELNNCRTKPVVIQPPALLPDVVITDISISPSNPEVGDTVQIFATVKNIGTAATPTNTDVGVGVTIDGTYHGAFFVRNSQGQARALAVNESYTGEVTTTWNPSSSRNYQICATADDINRFPELNEGNNTRCESFYVAPNTPEPDVIVTDISWSPSNPKVGDTVTLSATIQNIGDASTPLNGSTPVPIGVGFQVDGSTLGAYFVTSGSQYKSLAPNETYTGSCTTTWTPSIAKNYSIFAMVDDVNRFPESNDNNNTRTETVTVQDLLPDLIITNITLTPSSPRVGDVVTVRATVKNVGTAPTPLNGSGTPIPIGVGFQVNGSTLGAFFVTSNNQYQTLAVNESYTGTCNMTWTPTSSGTKVIAAIADDVNRFPELDDSLSSNRKTKSVFVSN